MSVSLSQSEGVYAQSDSLRTKRSPLAGAGRRAGRGAAATPVRLGAGDCGGAARPGRASRARAGSRQRELSVRRPGARARALAGGGARFAPPPPPRSGRDLMRGPARSAKVAAAAPYRVRAQSRQPCAFCWGPERRSVTQRTWHTTPVPTLCHPSFPQHSSPGPQGQHEAAAAVAGGDSPRQQPPERVLWRHRPAVPLPLRGAVADRRALRHVVWGSVLLAGERGRCGVRPHSRDDGGSTAAGPRFSAVRGSPVSAEAARDASTGGVGAHVQQRTNRTLQAHFCASVRHGSGNSGPRSTP